MHETIEDSCLLVSIVFLVNKMGVIFFFLRDLASCEGPVHLYINVT